jgi:hypothetical protein
MVEFHCSWLVWFVEDADKEGGDHDEHCGDTSSE